MNWFIRLIKKLFCCLSLDDNNEHKKLLNKSSFTRSTSNNSIDSFPIYAVYPEGKYFRSSSNLSNISND